MKVVRRYPFGVHAFPIYIMQCRVKSRTLGVYVHFVSPNPLWKVFQIRINRPTGLQYNTNIKLIFRQKIMEHDYASNISKSCVKMRFRDDTF